METLSIAMLCWFAGTWDSTVYNRSEHPQTVALRFEVRDAETGLPVKDATLTLKGEYREERVGPSGDEFGKPHEPQPREFEMSTRTGAEGIAVFALGWKKIYPWDIGKPNQKDWQGNEVLGGVHISWTKAMDDIEKVQRIVIRHPRYREKMFKVNFNHLTDVGQEPDRQTQEPKVFEAFRNAWAEEMKREDVRCCVLNLGTQFKKFQNKQCTQSEFFEAIRDKRFGVVYTEPKNWFSFGDPPQSECGPYFVYLAEIGMEKTAGQIELVNDRSDNAEVRRRSRTINSEPAEDQTSAAKSQRSSERLAPGGRVAQAAERSVKARPERSFDAVQDHRIGLTVETFFDATRRQLGLYPGVQGVLVISVQAGSPADKAGLADGLVIESVDQRFVGTLQDYMRFIGTKKQGSQVDIGVWEKFNNNWRRGNRRVSL